MAAHQKTLAVICIALVAAIGTFVYLQASGRPENPENSAVSEEDASAWEEQSSLLTTQTASIIETQRLQATPELKAQLFAEYRCQKSACNMSPFLAENENEAVWLRQRGYPSEQQREEAKRLPTVELKSRTDKGDLIAASLYGERLMEEGDYEKAYVTLLQPATKGSLYALYGLSYNALNHPKTPDYISARTYLRLAYLAGDYKATIQLTQTAPHMNGQPEQLQIDEYAAHKFRNLLHYQSYPRPPSKF
jgi:hypothetical protein